MADLKLYFCPVCGKYADTDSLYYFEMMDADEYWVHPDCRQAFEVIIECVPSLNKKWFFPLEDLASRIKMS